MKVLRSMNVVLEKPGPTLKGQEAMEEIRCDEAIGVYLPWPTDAFCGILT